MTTTFRPTFCGLPLRALRDRTLSALELRILGAICAHDRFNANGQACWASNARIAEVAGCHLKSVPRAISSLTRKGYVRDIGTEPGERRGRNRFLTVIYTEADGELFGGREREPAGTPQESIAAAVQDKRESVTATTEATATDASRGGAKVTELGYPDGNRALLPKDKRKILREAGQGSAIALPAQPRRQAWRPPPMLPLLDRVLDRKAEAERWLANELGRGDLSAGYQRLRGLPGRGLAHA